MDTLIGLAFTARKCTNSKPKRESEKKQISSGIQLNYIHFGLNRYTKGFQDC